MRIAGRPVLLCDCGGTMRLDAREVAGAARRAGVADEGPEPVVHRRLCRQEIAGVQRASLGAEPPIVACTQEVAAFRRAIEEAGAKAAPTYVNIREAAGWTRASGALGPKVVALLAAAVVPASEPDYVEVESRGRVLVYGRDQTALDAASRLARRLEVRLVLAPGAQGFLPAERAFPVEVGWFRSASGTLGDFRVLFDAHSESAPWSLAAPEGVAARDGVARHADLVLDLSGGGAWFPAPHARLGYFAPDPARPGTVADALFDLAELVGTIAKPRYVAYERVLCAHSASRKTGCTRCLDVCPTGALASTGTVIAVDPLVCGGCGGCAAVCPTGAMRYAFEPQPQIVRRIAVLLDTYLAAGGGDPVLLIHGKGGEVEVLSALARHGEGLPVNVLPLGLRHPTQLGLDALLAAFAFGASRLLVWTGDGRAGEASGLESQVSLARRLLEAVGMSPECCRLLDTRDPDRLLAEMTAPGDTSAVRTPPAGLPEDGRGAGVRALVRHLAAARGLPPAPVPLPEGAPFGRVTVDDHCTVCLACAKACPTGALAGDALGPALFFSEEACVQCGLCEAVCPERAVSLEARLDLGGGVTGAVELARDEPALCPGCGRAFSSRRAIEEVIARLASFQPAARSEAIARRLRHCDLCRVELDEPPA